MEEEEGGEEPNQHFGVDDDRLGTPVAVTAVNSSTQHLRDINFSEVRENLIPDNAVGGNGTP